jgi:hypothetical protein
MKWMLVVMGLLGNEPGVVSTQAYDTQVACEVDAHKIANELAEAKPGVVACLGWMKKVSSHLDFGKQT